MAVPRLREEKCFIELDPAKLGKRIYKASSIKGAFEFGTQISVKQMKPIDLILCGSVAVRRNGARLGKGGGYSDLEYAIALEIGIITTDTPVITTVHPLQIIDDKFSRKPHDIPLDFIVTPDEIIDCKTRLAKPKGVYWEFLDDEKINAIPLLRKMKATRAT
jgi:5-formyltetrahydrofolate cyclo-ligase